ncbi:MAG: glycosyltransferase family 2 protein [Balneolaceae bacterium]
MKGFSIIIVTWNGLRHLQTFLPSVVESDYEDFEVILAENASDDDTIEWVKEYYPSVKIALFDQNYGYTGGNNKAVPFAEKEILIFLNNDVKVDPYWLKGLNDVFEKYDDVVAAQPKILSYKEPTYFEYAGAAGGFLDSLGYPFCRGRVMDTVEKDDGQYDSEIDIAWASGAALAFKKEIFEEMGGFDEDYQFHMEEIDLCWRTLNAGHRIIYTPESKVFHLGGGSLPMGSSRKVFFNFRNSLFMLWKNLSFSQLWYKFPCRIFLDAIAAWRSLLSGKPGEFIAITKAHFYFLVSFSSIHKKRSKTLRTKDIPVLSPVLLIWKYFGRGKKKFSDLL